MVALDIRTRGGHPDFLDLPWGSPLANWTDDRLIRMAHGVSRHVVRFVRYGDRVYALKETAERDAVAEYQILRDLRDGDLPVVEPVGVVSRRPGVADGVLITRYLDFSLPYWYLFGRDEPALTDRLLDAAVVLLVRLHLKGVFWGDCSLSNILFRRDAGAMMAYLVDAETTSRRPSIGDAQRDHDVEIAEENMVGGLLDLQAAGRVSPSVDPGEMAQTLRARYDLLWTELTAVEAFDVDERWRIDQRIRRINELGFDVAEVAVRSDGMTLEFTPVLVEEGHHARELRRRTALEVQENQARRLLADIENFRVWLEREQGRSVPAAVAAATWLADVYEPLLAAVPAALTARLEPAEIFHHLLEHRYFLSERRGAEVSNEEALGDYLTTVLDVHPQERHLEVLDDAE